MCARSTERAAARGFTLPELVAVLLLVSMLASVALPRLQGASSFRDDAWRDQVIAALRLAHQTAAGHRRLVCADVAGASVTLTIASANPASSCNAALRGIDGGSAAQRSGGSTSVSPAGTLYFQPSGRVSTDGAGTTAASRTIVIAGQADIVINGETGHVR